MDLIKKAEVLVDDITCGHGTTSILDARSMLCQLVAEVKSYKEGSEEAYGVLVEEKKELESTVKHLQSTIQAQQELIRNLQAAVGKRSVG